MATRAPRCFFTSDNARRDRDVRGRRLLDVATYPDITFECDRWRRDDGGWVASGTVTAHGASVPVDLVVDRVEAADGGFRVHGRAEHVDRYAFGSTGVRGLAGRYLDLEVDAAFVVA